VWIETRNVDFISCLISYTDFYGRHIGAPKRDTNMADAYCVLEFSENYFLDNFVLESTIDPTTVDVVCFYLPFNTFFYSHKFT